MRALRGVIPRAFKDHRSAEGVVYGNHVRAILARLGPLPKDARPLLKEAGRLVVDLDRLRADQERALRRNRYGEARRIDRRLIPLRSQLLTIEARLEEIAARHRPEPTVDDLLKQMIADSQREQAGDGD